MTFFRAYFLSFLILLGSALPTAFSYAADRNSGVIVRDIEGENLLRQFAAPLLVSAGLIANVQNVDRLEVYILQSEDVNAFTFGGLTLVVTTELLRTFSAEAVIGVIAHEIGHMANRHVALRGEAMEQASKGGIASMILGLGAGILNPALGMAILTGGGDIARKNFLSYSRSQESAADQAALKYLERSGYTAKGLKESFDYFEKHSFLPNNPKIEYFLSHPVPRNRERALKTHLASSPYSKDNLPRNMRENYNRIVAKLEAYQAPYFVLKSLKAQPASGTIAASYGQAVALMRVGKYRDAEVILDTLITREPYNPYFLELKAQIVFENGRIKEATYLYKKILILIPNEPLVQIALAHALIEGAEESQNYKLAVKLLEKANSKDQTAFGWRLMATALGRMKQEGAAAYALAEEAVLNHDRKTATYQTARALKKLDPNSVYYQKATDIKLFLEHF